MYDLIDLPLPFCESKEEAHRRRRVLSCRQDALTVAKSLQPKEATLKACLEHGAPEDAVQAAKAEFHAHLASNKNQQTNYELVEDSELLSEDRELDSDNQGMIY